MRLNNNGQGKSRENDEVDEPMARKNEKTQLKRGEIISDVLFIFLMATVLKDTTGKDLREFLQL